jgi:HEAT repeat protein
MKRLLFAVLLVVLILVACGAFVQHLRRQHDPLYHGRPVSEWSHQAVWDEGLQAREKAVEVLLEALQRPPAERGNAYSVLAGFQRDRLPKEVLPLLEGAAKDEDELLRGYALTFLPRVGPIAVPALIRLLTDKSNPHRREAASRLGLLGAKAQEALPALKAATRDDPDRDVRNEAAEAIRRIEAAALNPPPFE